MALSQRQVIRRIRLLLWMHRVHRRQMFKAVGLEDRSFVLRLEASDIEKVRKYFDIPAEVWNIPDEGVFLRTIQSRNRSRRDNGQPLHQPQEGSLPDDG
jgi:hypothetical protein